MRERDHARSETILAVLMIAVGYLTLWRGILLLIIDMVAHTSVEERIEQAAWDNEACAWSMIVSPFNLLACLFALRIRKSYPTSSVFIILLGVAGLLLTWWGFNPADPCPVQSKADDNALHLSSYWDRGAGWLAGIVIIPCLIAYVLAYIRDRKRAVG